MSELAMLPLPVYEMSVGGDAVASRPRQTLLECLIGEVPNTLQFG